MILNLVYLWILASIINPLIENKTNKQTKKILLAILIGLIILMTVMEITIKEKQYPPQLQKQFYGEKNTGAYHSLLNEKTLLTTLKNKTKTIQEYGDYRSSVLR